tara:strand:- start:48554 stop:49660 length:1107 start_codon:yes stop_codon:yes gene_type:complete
MNIHKFANEAIKSSIEFFDSLQMKENFNFLPALEGLTDEGKNLKLGFSTFGMKMYYMNGEWDKLPSSLQKEWVDFINSFQKNVDKLPPNSYVDPVIYNFYNHNNLKKQSKEIVKNALNFLPKYSFDSNEIKFHKAINAETKQAISSLYQVGFKNYKDYDSVYNTSTSLLSYLKSLDWNKPWTSGAQYASLCVYSKINLDKNTNDLIEFINQIVDKDTGSYFTGNPSHSREVINGAMKVLSGLDWLDCDIHYPEKLIEYCLSNVPLMEGCDIVDYIYVLYRCTKQTDYRKKDVLQKLNDSIYQIKELYKDFEKGFSYFKNKSQTHYYGVTISSGLDTSDIHGTLLCNWGLIMILDANEVLDAKYKIIKP